MIDFNLLYFHIVNLHEITPLKDIGPQSALRSNWGIFCQLEVLDLVYISNRCQSFPGKNVQLSTMHSSYLRL